MSYHAHIHDRTTDEFLLACRVVASNLHDAQSTAIYHAGQALTCNPQDMDVGHLHECAKRPEAFAPDRLHW